MVAASKRHSTAGAALAMLLCAGTACAAVRATLPGSDEIVNTDTAVIDVQRIGDLDSLLAGLADKRVVLVGETHDRYEDHLNQLAIIRGLRAQGKDLAIGMEYFQQPFQVQLDAFISGAIGEADMLRKTEYFDRWRYDYRLYRPILRYARDEDIPLIALNIEKEITDKVAEGGIASLSKTEASRIPADIDRGNEQYRSHLKAVFDMHPKEEGVDFEHFLDVQLLWDEGMAERAARYLKAHPEKTLVVLAGAGHLEYGRGIPRRLLRRVPVPAATVINGSQRPFDPALADFLLYPREVDLPATGLLGVMLDTDSAGEGLGVQGFADTSGAKDAGLKEGDRIARVGNNPIASYADIRIALMDSRPGETLPVEVLRKPLLGKAERLTYQVELH